MKRLLIGLLVFSFTFTIMMPIHAEITADDIFMVSTVTLSSSKTASFSARTYEIQDTIYVTSCVLYKKVNDYWTYVTSLSAPSVQATNASLYGAVMDYSNNITESGVYRISAIFYSAGHYAARFSNTITVN